MYCPKCLKDSLSIHSRGVVRLQFNGKQKDNSQFLFNLKKDKEEDLKNKLRDKIEDFMSWYSQFQNKTPIKNVDVYSMDFICKTGCTLDVGNRFSLIGIVFEPEDVIEIVKDVAQKYQIPVEENLNSDV
jgi:hypothetical protein